MCLFINRPDYSCGEVFFMAEEEIRLEDVFDMEFLQKFQDNFARAAGMTAVTVDKDGKPVTRPTDWSEFCMKYTRGSSEGCRRCEQCDKNGGETAARTGKPSVYECHAGLMDFGAPIIVDGKQIGSILGGQILNAPPDEDKFRAYAAEIGVDPEKYVEAVRKIQIMPKERLEYAAETLFLMATSFSKMGHYQSQLKKMATSINGTAMQVSAAMEELAASANDVNENQKALNKEIENVSEISSKINEFTNLIRDIAKQTRLLGLNASIEAARAGTAGAGFAVVSEEIGKLADSSRETVDKIQEFTSQIGESVDETVSKGEATSEIVAQQTAAIAEVAQELTRLSETAGTLVALANTR